MGLTKNLGWLSKYITADSAGNIGVGVASPLSGGGSAKWLTVDGTTYGGGFISSVNGVSKGTLYYDQASLTFSMYAPTGVGATIHTNGSERMRIFSSGNVFIGSSPADSGYKLDVNGTGRFSGSVRIGNVDFGTSQVLSIAPGVVGIDAPGVGNGRFVVNGSGKVGISTADPRTKFHNNGSFLTQLNWYGEAKSFYFQCAFNNPTIDLFTSNSTTSYGAVIIRVTIYHNTVSTGISDISVGYANWAGNPLPTISRGIIAPVIQASFNGAANVGTLYWDFNTLKFTANRNTNYDGYSIIVEWGANGDYNQFPTYGANLP